MLGWKRLFPLLFGVLVCMTSPLRCAQRALLTTSRSYSRVGCR